MTENRPISTAFRTLVIIPARGGSKGIPRKNLRALRGEPLISYVIRTALASRFRPDVYVSSEDDEILSIAEKLGATPHRRPRGLAEDETTLDAVVFEAFREITAGRLDAYDLVATIQPTSPLLRTASLDAAIEGLLASGDDTVISAIRDAHLTWTVNDGRFVPNYEERRNRQDLPPLFRETGGFLISRASVLTPDARIGDRVSLHLLTGGEAVDIDTLEDFNLCEWYLSRRHVLFVVSGYPEIGLGHVYNAITIATDLVKHDLTFLVDRRSKLALEILSGHHYAVTRQESGDLVEEITHLAPDVVINDVLDTSEDYVRALKKLGIKVINFEDLGPGALYADLVINAIYPERQIHPNHYFGHRYFCARTEFTLTAPKLVDGPVSRVLLTFGGTDLNNLTAKVLTAIHGYCQEHGISVDVVAGMGYQRFETLQRFAGVGVERNVANISDFMRRADIIFTSAGRTVFEIACIGTPAIVLAQNERELTHLFASEEHGFVHLGLGRDVEEATILQAFRELVEESGMREHMSRLMLEHDIRSGKDRVLRLLDQVIGGE
ncbi:MAG: acylneuraminate cytidylyltransferase [Chloroflexota bacterium]